MFVNFVWNVIFIGLLQFAVKMTLYGSWIWYFMLSELLMLKVVLHDFLLAFTYGLVSFNIGEQCCPLERSSVVHVIVLYLIL